jgi:hypothetical protein
MQNCAYYYCFCSSKLFFFWGNLLKGGIKSCIKTLLTDCDAPTQQKSIKAYLKDDCFVEPCLRNPAMGPSDAIDSNIGKISRVNLRFNHLSKKSIISPPLAFITHCNLSSCGLVWGWRQDLIIANSIMRKQVYTLCFSTLSTDVCLCSFRFTRWFRDFSWSSLAQHLDDLPSPEAYFGSEIAIAYGTY